MFESVCEPTVAGVQHADPFTLAAALAPLTEDALMTLTADEAECVIAATQRVVNAMAARQAVAVDRYTQHIAEQAATADPGRGDERQVLTDTAAMLAPILRIAPRTMTSRIEQARWGGCLPRTFAAGWAGDLEPYRVAAITSAAMTLGFDDLVEYEARLYDRDITDLAAARVKDRAVKIAHRLAARHPDPDPVLPRWVRTTGDERPGCTRWSALLPTDRSARMWAAIDTLAGEYLRANPALTVSEARADAFTDLLLGNAHVTAEVTIVLPADHAPYSQENPLHPDCADHDQTQPDTDEASQAAPGQHEAAGDRGEADPSDREPATHDEAAAGRHDDTSQSNHCNHGHREQAPADEVAEDDVSAGDHGMHEQSAAEQSAQRSDETAGDHSSGDYRDGGAGDIREAEVSDGAISDGDLVDGDLHRMDDPEAAAWARSDPDNQRPELTLHEVEPGPDAPADHADAAVGDSGEPMREPEADSPPGPWPWGASSTPGGDGDEPDGGRPLPAPPSAQDRAAEVRELVARLKALPPPTPPQPLPRGALPRTAREAWLDIAWAQRFTWDASELELHVGGQLSHCLRVDVNPYLTRDPSGDHVWFVPGPVAAPGLGCLIPAQLTALLADPDLRIRLARAHPDTGAVDALDQRTYRPGAALARLVRARDGTCRFPGCATPAGRCHLDHVTRYPDGPTTAANLQTLCAAHHGFKHHATWSVTMTPDGICTWTAPNGRTHTTDPYAVHDQAA